VRALALDVLGRIEAGAWSDRLLAEVERGLPAVRDRQLLHRLVLDTLRWQGALDAVLAPRVRGGLGRLDPPVRAALRVGLAQASVHGLPVAVAVDTAVAGARAVQGRPGAGLVNAVLRRCLAPGPPELDAAATVPGWLLERWRRTYGADAAAAMVATINRPPRPFLVARAGSTGRDALATDLAREEIATRPARRHPAGLEVLGGAPQTSPRFAAGEFVLVDEGAALVAWLAAPRDERPAADLAAAPGGKASLLAWQAAGPVVALERQSGRARALAATLARTTGAADAAALRADAGRAPLADGSCGTVLLDAPCSGTGTLRRRPERRHRLGPGDIDRCARDQSGLLSAAARLVGRGGGLVYAVCSLEPEEGVERVRALLAADPGLRPVDPAERLGPAADGLVTGDPPVLLTRPDIAGTEGFVAARLERRA
jgi:16S rRNA (cytosine967-C5)-methyltransferase